MPSSLRQKSTTDESTLGTNAVPWEKVFTKDAQFQGDVEIQGSLTVTGDAKEVTVDKLSVEEPMIKVAKINTGAGVNSADIGLYGVEDTDGTPKYHGLVRDADDATWKLFEANREAPADTTVNFSGTGSVDGTLQAKVNLPAAGDLKIAGTAVSADAAELNVLDGATAGTAVAGKALVVDGSKDISGIATLTAQTLSAGNISINGSAISSSSGAPSFANVAITGGTIDGTAIGANTASSGAFTALTASGVTALSGAVTLGDAAADDITLTGSLASSIVLKTDSTYNLGTASVRMAHIYSDEITASTINAFTAGGAIDFNDVAMTNVNIGGGAIDGTIIGANSAAAANVANLVVSGTAQVDGDLTLSGGDGALTFDAAGSSIKIPENSATALVVEQGSNAYLTFVSTNSSEKIVTNKALDASAGITLAANEIETADIKNANVTLAKIEDVAEAKILIGPTNGGTLAEQTISGDATLAAGGALTIKPDVVTYDKIQDVAESNKLLGAVTAGTVVETEVKTAMISDDQVTYAKIQNVVTANRLLGSTSANGIVTELQVQEAMIADDQVTNAKLANITRGSIKVGGAANAPTDLDAKTDGQILVGNGTDIASVAISGDATLTSSGALTIANDSITAAKLAHTTVTAGNYGSATQVTSLTVDTQGRLTSASSTTIDIPHTQVNDFDAAVQASRLDQMAAPTAAISLNNQKITNLATPTVNSDAASKSYVDGVAQGLKVHDNVKAATTENGALSSAFAHGQSIDGVTLSIDDRILIKNQTNASENGIYAVGSVGAPSRVSDMNAADEFAGSFVFVTQGTNNADCSFVCTVEPDNFTLETTDVTWAQFASAGQITASTGLSKTGNSLSITPLTVSRALVSDGSGNLSASAVTSTEVGYLDGVTSAIQTQIDSKQATLTGATATLVTSNLTNDRALLSDGSGKIAVSDVTNTELGYLDGVSSSIQTQLNAKQGLHADLTDLSGCQTGAAAALALLTSTEVEILDGATLTTTELNYVDGVTSGIQTQLNGKQGLNANLTALNDCQTGAAAALALLTSNEVAILNGATVTTAQLNNLGTIGSNVQDQLDAKQPLDAELTELATMNSGTAAALADLTSAEVAFLDGALLGQAVASKALVVDADSKIATGLASITATEFKDGTATLTGGALTGANISEGSINNTPIGATTRSSGEFTSLQASDNVDFTDEVTIFKESSAVFRVGTTSNPSKAVLTVDTTNDAGKVYIAGDLVVNKAITAGDTESGSLNIKGGLQYDVDDTIVTSRTLGTNEHLISIIAPDYSVDSADRVLTLPAASGNLDINKGREYIIVRDNDDGGVNQIKLVPQSTEKIYFQGNEYDTTSKMSVRKKSCIRVISNGTSWFAIGDPA